MLRMAKYSHTPISFFMSLSIDDLYGWMDTVAGEIDRQNREIERQVKGGGRHG